MKTLRSHCWRSRCGLLLSVLLFGGCAADEAQTIGDSQSVVTRQRPVAPAVEQPRRRLPRAEAESELLEPEVEPVDLPPFPVLDDSISVEDTLLALKARLELLEEARKKESAP